MSVPAYERTQSPMEYITIARDLLKYTRMICVKKLPKQYTFYGGLKIYEAAENIFKNVIKANKLNVISDFNKRQEYLKDALGEIDYLSGRVDLLMEDMEIEERFLYK